MPPLYRSLAVPLCLAALVAGCQLVPDRTAASAPTGSPAPAAPTSTSSSEDGSTRVEIVGPGQVALTYVDVAGAERRIHAEVRLPDGDVADPLPAVVWSHGGSAGRRSTDGVGSRWGRAFNEAGIAFVAIAHTGRTAEERVAVCAAVGAEPCEEFNTLTWDRPHDVVHVLDWIDREHRSLGIDPARLVYGGHSAGAVGVLTVAGMAWPFGSALAPPSDPRPVAFLAASPPGVEARGLGDGSFVGLDRPVLFLTGLGDTTRSTDAADRRAAFDLLPSSSDGALLWIERASARHTLFDLNTDACVRSGDSERVCRRMARLVAEVGVVFVSAGTSGGGDVGAALTDRFDGVLPDVVTLTTNGG